MKIELGGKVAWVTGASRGIGSSTVRKLAEAGANVAIGFNTNEAAATALCNELSAFGVNVLPVQVDVASEQSVTQAHQKIVETLGEVEILVNNAGVVADDLFVMLDDAAWHKVLNVNLMGAVHCARVCTRGMMMKRWGRIINLSSVAGTKGGRGQSNYAASKGALEAMTRSLAVELGGRGINVNCVAPGVIETEMSKEVVKLAKDEIMSRQIIKRLGKPDEVAAWIVMLASSFGDYMTGQTIHIDGGLKMV
jgi:3-oxoacyl-[acyl-carrier protein] reductase